MAGGGKGENPARWPGIALNDDPEFWMTRFPAPLKNIPIIHLAIPGRFKTCSLCSVTIRYVEINLSGKLLVTIHVCL